ncbi:ribosomal protein S6 [Pneumocystis murina B123]|uniref:Ribosomal protein S6 n=1 Tax=Pneumocystis murina (strain B123) TaxID=1069680 RepID=M7NRF6_PNEMU|nr:ribosomal protein S6 [Pneumocystis murina B123]EMR09852.1 ribosomal protein S6 [Pneumocystis murina B123]
MVLYELLCITKADLKIKSLRELAKTSGSTIINKGGIIRGFEDWGNLILPKKKKKHQQIHHEGRHWTMLFDSNPQAQLEINKILRLDPRVINYSIIKLGSKLHEISEKSN